MVDFKVGDICLLRPVGYQETPWAGPYKVVIRDRGYHTYHWTVENIGDPAPDIFHKCVRGPIVFNGLDGRWCNNSELELISASTRSPTRFGKFIQRIEGK